jgi:hypothetical protein
MVERAGAGTAEYLAIVWRFSLRCDGRRREIRLADPAAGP